MKSHASMNRIYRLVWNATLNLWVAVAENAKGRGKGGSVRSRVEVTSNNADSPAGGFGLHSRCRAALVLMLSLGLFSSQAQAADAADASVVAGSGTVNTSGNTTTINQSSQRLAIDWISLSTRANESLVFQQPNAKATALNRITGSSPSELLGSLTANGQVFILNPNGVLFGAGAQVNVGGLVASTLSMSNADFMAGNNTFSGNSGSGSVVNKGSLSAAAGGYLALLAPEVRNEGVISATLGTALLAAGNKVTLNLNNGSLLGYSIDQGAVKALAENKHLIQANGGQVLLSARALDKLTTATVNNTGVIEARTIQNQAGRIMLMGDMESGTVNVGGTLDASAPTTGNGGFIETSAAHVKVASGTKVSTLAASGTTGKWLIDPNDFTIAATGGDMDAATVQSNLASTNFEIATATMGTAGGNGDIFVDQALGWSSANTLTLTAQRNININQNITASNGGLTLNAGGGISAPAAVDVGTFTLVNGAWSQIGGTLPTFSATDFRISGGSFIRALAGDGGSATPYQLNDIFGLQGAGSAGMLDKYYTLANNIDASGTVNWNAGAGFVPLGFNSSFAGSLDGQGHSISDLTIYRPMDNYVGLFSTLENGSTVANVGLTGGSVTGDRRTGALVGQNYQGSISNSYATTAVTGYMYTGGLVGQNYQGTITDSYATGPVTGTGGYTGGLAGHNDVSGSISNSYATGVVNGQDLTGGLTGRNDGSISNSYAAGAVTGTTDVGGLAGRNDGSISNSYASGATSGNGDVGGLAGMSAGSITNSYASGAVAGGGFTGGLVGYRPSGLILNSFWNTDTSGQAGSDGGTGKTSAEMKQLSTFAGWDIDDAGGTGKVWRIYEGNTGPLLRSFLTQLVLQPTYDGSGATLGQAGELSIPGSTDMGKVFGGITGDGTLTLASNGLTGSYSASSSASIAGLYSNQKGYDISKASRTISTPGSAAGDVNVANGINYTNGSVAINAVGNASLNGINSANGSVAINAGGDISNTGATDVALFDLKAGVWSQLNSILPSFRAMDFRISGGSFLRALGGDGSVAAPYQLADVYGLQGAGSLVMLGSYNYLQVNNIDASGTANWNGGAGFKPIGDNSVSYEGVFNGQGYNIGGLVINRPTTDYVGLFGEIDRGEINNVNLVGGSITGQNTVGALAGLAGPNSTLNNNSASTAVNGNDSVGGLVGWNYANITNSRASGDVSGHNAVGGLVGDNRHSLSGNHAEGQVNGNEMVGGLLGYSDSGTVSNSYATGNVFGAYVVGGLIGFSVDDITNSYATGDVTASTGWVGGLVGVSNANVSYSYSSGLVSGASVAGGLVGESNGSVNNSFWNTDTSGQTTSAGGGSGKTTAELKQLSTFAGWDIDDAGGTGKVWRIYEGYTGPLLRSFMTQLTLLPEYDGSGNALDHIGDIVAPVGTDLGKLFGTATGTGSLTLASNGLAGSHTATSSSTGAGLYSNQQGYDIVVAPRTISTPGSAAGDVQIDKPLDWTDGTLKINAAGNINFGGNSINGGRGSGLELNAGNAISNAGDLFVDLFDLKAGTWSQIGSTLPQFYADDFRISGGSFMRALGGDGLSTATAYQLNDIYGLQGVGSAGMLDKHYILADDIYAGGTLCWNLCGTSYAGFRPIGDGTTPFTGSFNGNNYEIRNLFINQTSGINVALFGVTGATSNIHDLNLADVDVTGYGNVAALVGTNAGNIGNVHVSGLVAGQSSGGTATGGLVGTNNGSIDNSMADVEVSGFALVGGLVGNNVAGSISNSLAVGKVTGASTGVGGLVGNNDADSTIADSWASGAVASTGDNTGGLVGLNSGGITRSYASGDVDGVGNLGGLVGLNAGAIDKSYASGVVTSTGGSGVGGLAGYNADGSIENSYASGAVVAASSTEVGGLVGLNEASVAYSYATGLVDGGANSGGLVGLNDVTGSVRNSVWDAQTTAQTHSSGSGDENGKTSAEMKQAATFAGWDIASEGGSSAVWRIYEGQTGPLLRNFMTSLVLGDTTVTYDTTTHSGASTALAGVFGSASSGRNAGNYASGYYSGQHGYDISGGELTINKANLVMTGLTAADRVYDGTVDAILNGSAQITALGSDDVTLSGTATGTFADKNAGSNKAVTVTGNTLSGSDAGNYKLIQPTNLKATIERKELTATATASDKVYTGGTSAKAVLTITSGLVGSETLRVQNLASFDSKDVATAGLVTVNKIGLYDGDNGGLGSNYRIVAGQTAAARITARNLRVAGKRAYDGTTDMQANIFGAAGTLKGVNGETVQLTGTGSVASKNVLAGTQTLDTSGLALANGTGQASNYNLSWGTARVYRKDLTATATASDKVYDGNTTASAAITITGGLVGTETVNTDVAARFNSKDVATATTVTVTRATLLDGADGGLASNYRLVPGQTAAAQITARNLTISGMKAQDKVVDGNTAATLTGGVLHGMTFREKLTFTGQTGNFDDALVGKDKAVTVTGLQLQSGTGDASNYTVSAPAGLKADIKP